MFISPSKSINKAFKQVTIERKSFCNFCDCLKTLLADVTDDQVEETQKNHLQAFLAKTFYGNYYMAPEGDIDLTVHLDKTAKSHIGLLIEVKSTTNKNEMISKEEINKKALHELLLYFLRERITHNNTDIKYLIATNIYEYYIFDAQIFEKYFFGNANLKKEFQDFENKAKTGTTTDFFYKEIAAKYIEEVANELDYTYFNLKDYKTSINKVPDSKSEDAYVKKLAELYRIFSDTHLLKLPFQNDSNSLNKNFYTELLYILGLEEKKIDNKYVIVRREEGRRNDSSLIENAINILDSEDRLESLTNISIYGETKNEQLFNVAMELCITWVNRILFLKLLEAQLLKYHSGDERYKFLAIKKIDDFDELNKLFFQVLARNYDDRKQDVKEKYGYIPYLNSSLFEMNELERKTIAINSLSQASLTILPTSVLKNNKNIKVPESLPVLQYIFDFLDAYNFSSEGTDDIQDNAKTLINASVLGLIFEKINGQKDGSVFTPGFITMFMSKETVERVVLHKFNEEYGWHCEKLIDLYNNIENHKAANEIINNLKICDPAVGSGHYLVSVLNEIIRIKYELGILTDDSGKRIKKQNYIFSIENDELIVTDEEGELFKYIPGNPESQRIQELLFREKRQIIENCLFGIDINQNAVNICRLRLWIELLKNAYYTKESNYTLLETLPNIDINIKCGNSLLHRFDLKDNIQTILKDAKISISEYKAAVDCYKRTSNKINRKGYDDIIQKIKSTLNEKLLEQSDLAKKIKGNRDKLNDLYAPTLVAFRPSKNEKNRNAKSIINLKKLIAKQEKQLEEVKSGKIYLNAFEWRFEFPEVLDNDGNFVGFDCIIGNPPYVSTKGVSSDDKILLKKCFGFADDLYSHFFFMGNCLLRNNGFLAFITPKTYWTTQTKKNLRQFLLNNRIHFIVDTGCPFEGQVVDTCITLIEKCKNDNCIIEFDDRSDIFSKPVKYKINQSIFSGALNYVFFLPTDFNIKVFNKYGPIVKSLYEKWWSKIKTSQDIEKNKEELEKYRATLQPGDIALLGCLTEGGVGLQTGDNGKYIAIKRTSKLAEKVIASRPIKLQIFIKNYHVKIDHIDDYSTFDDFMKSLSESEISILFDNLKEKYGRDIFGQGYVYRIADDSQIADVDLLTNDEKENGIDSTNKYYVPFDKGDKEGNRWYLDTPYVIAWTKENVQFFKTNSGKSKGSPVVRNPQFYFREGFCWNNVLTTYIKCRKKGKTIQSTESMSLFSEMKGTPESYLISIINSSIVALYVDAFINSTSHCTIGDAKLIPIIVPSESQLTITNHLFQTAINIINQKCITTCEKESLLSQLQNELDVNVSNLYLNLTVGENVS